MLPSFRLDFTKLDKVIVSNLTSIALHQWHYFDARNKQLLQHCSILWSSRKTIFKSLLIRCAKSSHWTRTGNPSLIVEQRVYHQTNERALLRDYITKLTKLTLNFQGKSVMDQIDLSACCGNTATLQQKQKLTQEVQPVKYTNNLTLKM